MNRDYLILTGSVVYAAVFNGLIIGFYSLFSLSMPGMTRFFNIDYFFLIVGFVLVSVFSYLAVSFDSDENRARCSSFMGLIIISFCLFPSLFLLFFFYLLPVFVGSFSWAPSGNLLCFLLPLILSIIGILFAIRSFKSLKQCGKPVIDRGFTLKKWGLFIGVVFYAIGLVMTGVTLTFGMVNVSTICYEVAFEVEEPTRCIVPVPLYDDESIHGFADRISLSSGEATWEINKMEYGMALIVNATSNCTLIAEEQNGIKSRNEIDSWFEQSSVTMTSGEPNDEDFIAVAMFSSTNTSRIRFHVSYSSGLGTTLSYRLYDYPLKKGWQNVTLNRSIATI
jgi:MFS family permease